MFKKLAIIAVFIVLVFCGSVTADSRIGGYIEYYNCECAQYAYADQIFIRNVSFGPPYTEYSCGTVCVDTDTGRYWVDNLPAGWYEISNVIFNGYSGCNKWSGGKRFYHDGVNETREDLIFKYD